jgi:Leucine-rich repeat (LRR) protein
MSIKTIINKYSFDLNGTYIKELVIKTSPTNPLKNYMIIKLNENHPMEIDSVQDYINRELPSLEVSTKINPDGLVAKHIKILTYSRVDLTITQLQQRDHISDHFRYFMSPSLLELEKNERISNKRANFSQQCLNSDPAIDPILPAQKTMLEELLLPLAEEISDHLPEKKSDEIQTYLELIAQDLRSLTLQSDVGIRPKIIQRLSLPENADQNPEYNQLITCFVKLTQIYSLTMPSGEDIDIFLEKLGGETIPSLETIQQLVRDSIDTACAERFERKEKLLQEEERQKIRQLENKALPKIWKELQKQLKDKLTETKKSLKDKPEELAKLKKILIPSNPDAYALRAWLSNAANSDLLAQITHLDLNNQDYEIFPAVLCTTLKNLQLLDLSHNKLDSLPSEIGKLKKLRQLRLGNNQIASLPSEIGELKNLQWLDLSFNKLDSLPSEIGELKNLQKLDFSFNELASLPSEIKNLQNLKSLCLSGNRLTTLPPEIKNLQNLKNLYLSINRLTTLPPEIGNLSKLQELNFSNNQIASLPSEIGNLLQLQELNLASNQIASLPSEIGELKNLLRLYLSRNLLTTLPPQIGELKKLERLNLASTLLNALPSEIGNLESLQFLSLYNHQLTRLPLEIGNLKSLQELYLSHHQLNSLPPEIGKLEYLQLFVILSNKVVVINYAALDGMSDINEDTLHLLTQETLNIDGIEPF